MSRKCVICDTGPQEGRLALLYAMGKRQGYREAETGPDDEAPKNSDPLCATHRRQVSEASLRLIFGGAKSSPAKGATPKRSTEK